jgi:hypothetical protein
VFRTPIHPHSQTPFFPTPEVPAGDKLFPFATMAPISFLIPVLTVLKHLTSALQNVTVIPIGEGTCSGFPSSYNTAYSCVATDKLPQLIIQFNATTLKTVVANSSSRMLTRIAAFKPIHLEANDTLVETQTAFNTTIGSLSGHGSSLFKL